MHLFSNGKGAQPDWVGHTVSVTFSSLRGLAVGISVEAALRAGHTFPEALACMPSTLADSTHAHSKAMCFIV